MGARFEKDGRTTEAATPTEAVKLWRAGWREVEASRSTTRRKETPADESVVPTDETREDDSPHGTTDA